MYNAVLVVYHNKSVDHLDLMHILDVIYLDITYITCFTYYTDIFDRK